MVISPKRWNKKNLSVNLKAQNGEDVWIEHHTKPNFTSNYKKVDLYAIRDGKQAGVLVGDKLNIYGHDNIFIQIKPEKELLLNSNYEKTAYINEIIAKRNKKIVLYSILGSIIMAAFLLKRHYPNACRNAQAHVYAFSNNDSLFRSFFTRNSEQSFDEDTE